MNELVTPDNVTKEMLKSILEAAFITVSYDEDGDLRIQETIGLWAQLPENHRRIHLLSLWGFKDGVSDLQKLQAVNRINNEYNTIKASVTSRGRLSFEWDIPLEGGITKSAFVHAVKRFCQYPRTAIQDCAADLVG